MTPQNHRPCGTRRHRRWISTALASLVLMLLGTPIADATSLPLNMPHFTFEQQAQAHCPSDLIVWAIARLGVYNLNAERWYGQTNDGAYVCRHDAETAGYHAASATR